MIHMKCQVLFSLKITKIKIVVRYTFALRVNLYINILGPVVQSIVSLTSLLMTISLTIIAKYIDIFAAKIWVFSQKNINAFAIFQDRNFNITLDNNYVKFWTNRPWSWPLPMFEVFVVLIQYLIPSS